ncbi:MAG: hypothetical protein NTU54_06235 [Candidatus Omnitrophica bacterium]|nr:hypothetical protein [Candidatus Omnitrophota bacterium]
MKRKLLRNTLIIISLVPVVLFVAKFGGPSILKMYVRAGITQSHNQAIFSLAPEQAINKPEIENAYLSGLKHYRLPEIEISLPKDIRAVQGETTRTYYKKRPWRTGEAVAYILYEKPRFFMNLFPRLKKQGITSDQDFLSHTMSAKLDDIKTITDAFFVIMKGIFTPDLGDQKNLQMLSFSTSDKNGFISYNLNKSANYFDCNFFDHKGNFFKVYVKDITGSLDINKIFAIISTVKQKNG